MNLVTPIIILTIFKKKILYIKESEPKVEIDKIRDNSKRNNWSIFIVVKLITMRLNASYYIYTNNILWIIKTP